MTVKYQLLNIDCAHCAQEISEAISNISEINSAHVDFVNKLIYIDTKTKPNTALINKMQDVINSIENGVKIIPITDSKEKQKRFHKDLIFIFMSIAFFILGILSKPINYYLQLLLFILSIILCGYDTFKKGILSLFKFKLDEKSLMTIAAIAAFIIGDFTEGFFVILLFKIGNLLENLAVNRSRNSIKKLASVVPDTAFLLTNGTETKVSANDLKIDDIIKVHPFDKIPADGIVIDGTSSLNPCAITGESIPIDVSAGSKVLSGMINNSGTITVKVTAPASESAAGKIIKMIEEASMQKADTENIISRFARIYTPIVVILAVLLCIFPFILSLGPFDLWFRRSLVFLVASCPCAIVISVPLAFYSGVGTSSKFGILFKGSKYIEVLSHTDTIVFDKTATLTTGVLSISNIHSFDKNISKEAILNLAAAVESYSNHPIANAIKDAASGENPFVATNFTEYAGFGVCAFINNKKILCGNKKLFLENDYNMDTIVDCPLYIAIDKKIVGAMEFSDTVRDCAPNVISDLKGLNINDFIILSGDSENEVKKVAQTCGIDKFYSKLLPEDKLKIFNKIKESSRACVFIGDGINDTPTLAAADCGIAMGQGSVAAIEIGDVVFLNNNIDKLPASIKLSRKIMNIVKFNIGFALVVKVIVLILAALGIAPMWSAVIVDTGVTLLAVLNSSPKFIRY